MLQASEEAKKLTMKGDTSDEEPNMKKLLSLAVVSLFIGMTAMTLFGGQDRGGNEGIRGRFVGAWRLAWLEEEGQTGKFTRLTVPGCLSTRATATCQSK